MSYTVHLLAKAKADYRSIFRYIEKRSPQGAISWERAFEECLQRLRDNPTIYSLALEADLFEFALYQVLFQTKSGKRYRMVYRIDDQIVTVYRLRGHGQSPLKPSDLPNG